MCGFVGFVGEPGAMGAEAMERLAARMADRLESRGPDDAGTWVSPAAGIALGHRRLAVIDLTAAGRQPMVSASGRSVIAYNGEVYNFAEIRRDLEAEGRRFRGGSDTEVVLEACEAWGTERAVSQVHRHVRLRALGHPRPPHHSWCATVSASSRSIGAAQAECCSSAPSPRPSSTIPPGARSVDRDALAAYLRHAYVPAPRSIFKGIEKLEPGSMVEIDADGRESRRRYWDLRAIARNAVRDRAALDDETAVETLDGLLRDAVKRRMIADVPLGVFLSGGIDSSTVLALMQAQSARPVARSPSASARPATTRRATRSRLPRIWGRTIRSSASRTIMRSRSFRNSPPGTTSRSPIRRRSRPIWSPR